MAVLLTRSLVLRGPAGVSGLGFGARLGGAVAVTPNPKRVDPTPCDGERDPMPGQLAAYLSRTPPSVQGHRWPQA